MEEDYRVEYQEFADDKSQKEASVPARRLMGKRRKAPRFKVSDGGNDGAKPISSTSTTSNSRNMSDIMDENEYEGLYELAPEPEPELPASAPRERHSSSLISTTQSNSSGIISNSKSSQSKRKAGAAVGRTGEVKGIQMTSTSRTPATQGSLDLSRPSHWVRSQGSSKRMKPAQGSRRNASGATPSSSSSSRRSAASQRTKWGVTGTTQRTQGRSMTSQLENNISFMPSFLRSSTPCSAPPDEEKDDISMDFNASPEKAPPVRASRSPPVALDGHNAGSSGAHLPSSSIESLVDSNTTPARASGVSLGDTPPSSGRRGRRGHGRATNFLRAFEKVRKLETSKETRLLNMSGGMDMSEPVSRDRDDPTLHCEVYLDCECVDVADAAGVAQPSAGSFRCIVLYVHAAHVGQQIVRPAPLPSFGKFRDNIGVELGAEERKADKHSDHPGAESGDEMEGNCATATATSSFPAHSYTATLTAGTDVATRSEHVVQDCSSLQGCYVRALVREKVFRFNFNPTTTVRGPFVRIFDPILSPTSERDPGHPRIFTPLLAALPMLLCTNRSLRLRVAEEDFDSLPPLRGSEVPAPVLAS